MSKVTVCMIVKNEGLVIKKCLSSIAKIADEIIIVDTGSDDDTIKIAKQFTDKIYHFNWIDDFAAARNYAQSLAKYEYICRWDADWLLQEGDIDKLITAKNQNFAGADLYNLSFVEHFIVDTKNHVVPLFVENLFMFYRNKMFRWQSPIHNELVLINPNNQPKIFSNSDIIVLHQREERKKNLRKEQTLRILEDQLKKRNSNYQRMLYFYGRELYFDNQYLKVIEHFKLLLKLPIDQDLRDYTIEKIFFALFYAELFDQLESFDYLINLPKTSRLILLKADVLCLSDPKTALIYYLEYIQNPMLQKDTKFEYDIERYQVHSYLQIAKILINDNELLRAKEYLTIAFAKCISSETQDQINELIQYC